MTRTDSMTTLIHPDPISGDEVPWQERLGYIVDTMREISRQTDPQAMVKYYGERMRQILPSDRFIALSRRDLPAPQYRITRTSLWEDGPNPWKSKDRLPVFDRGLLGRLIYGDEPVVIDDLEQEDLSDDPAAWFLEGIRSLVAIPLFDKGVALNMVVQGRRQPYAFNRERLPEQVWMSNLFGRATHNLVLSEQVRTAYDAIDRELRVVGDIQRSLLPTELPRIPTLDLAVHYQTSQRAGGDYYDFFPLPRGQWGILMADVSGHGTPAAVLMAVTHSIAHTCLDVPEPPSRLLSFVNRHLAARYTNNGNFVTAFYGIYDPPTRRLTYSSAGHLPPRIRRCSTGEVIAMDRAAGLPLGIDQGEPYEDSTETFIPGDSVAFYTDGITEARSPAGELFGSDRLDDVLAVCGGTAAGTLDDTLAAVHDHTLGTPPTDDRTLLIAKVS